jgi:diphosphomevalonate decarboxylase
LTRRVIARAYSNIALTKYWGKASAEGNVPATPSISMALEKLCTETSVVRVESGKDTVTLNGAPASGPILQHYIDYLDFWRGQNLIEGRFHIESKTNFPVAAGLASSASGFASLAEALSGFAPAPIETPQLSRLARIGSGSAARSIPGGLASFPLTADPAAELLMAAEEIPWAMAAVIVGGQSKKVSSREGMRITEETSPYYQSWISRAAADFELMLDAIEKKDFTAVGHIAESNALAMHCCMMASNPPLFYWNPSTVEVIHAVGSWREDGFEVYFTIDAGPNVILFCLRDDLEETAWRAGRSQGVEEVIPSLPGGGAEIIAVECSE